MEIKKPIYFDYMATTPVDPLVVLEMIKYLGPLSHFGNPASTTHIYGKEAAIAVERARAQIADVIHAKAEELVFTSGATESNNLALLGAARFYQSKGKHIITMSTEHKSVLDTLNQLAKEGFEVTYIAPKADGLLDLNALDAALRPDTLMVSVMHVNNEIGVIQDIKSIGAFLQNKGIIFHVDAAQSAGKCAINVSEIPIQLMSLSAHKNYGPKGVGALYVRHKPRVRLYAQSFGGGHEGGLRSGTMAPHQIVGMGTAFALGESLREEEQARLLAYRNKLWQGIKSIPGIKLNGHEHHRVANNLNISFSGLDGDALLFALKDIAVSTLSACSSASTAPSYVLKALGLSDELAHASIRLSFGRFTTEAEIDEAINIITTHVMRLREMAPK